MSNHYSKATELLTLSGSLDHASTVSALVYLNAICRTELDNAAATADIDLPEHIAAQKALALAAAHFEILQLTARNYLHTPLSVSTSKHYETPTLTDTWPAV